MPKEKLTSWDVMKLIAARQSSRFAQRKNWLVIPNVSYGFLKYEADMLIISKAKYCTEIEVKVSFSDFKADFEKRKHSVEPDNRIKFQYYAAPMALAERHTELELPVGWGVIGVGDSYGVKVIKEALPRDARKIMDKELMILARLACFRVWRKE